MRYIFYTLLILCFHSQLAISQDLNLDWAIAGGGGQFNFTCDVVVNNDGDVYVAGYYDLAFDIDPGPGVVMLPAGNGQVGYLAKYDKDGNYLWHVRLDLSNGNDNARRLLSMPDGGVIVCSKGQFGVSNLDINPNGTPMLVSSASANDFLLICRYDKDGIAQWGYTIESDILDIARDDSGNIYTINARSSINTRDFDGISPGTQAADLSGNAAVAKYDPNFNFIWARTIIENGNGIGWSIDVDSDGHILVAGDFLNPSGTSRYRGTTALPTTTTTNTSLYLAEFDNNFNLLFHHEYLTIGGVSNNLIGSVTYGLNGNMFLSASYNGTIDMNPGAGTFNLTSTGVVNNGFITKLDASFNHIHSISIDATNRVYPYNMSVDNVENVTILGASISGSTVNFDPLGSAIIAFSGSSQQAFLAGYNKDLLYRRHYHFPCLTITQAAGNLNNYLDRGALRMYANGTTIIAPNRITASCDVDVSAGVFNIPFTATLGNMGVLKYSTESIAITEWIADPQGTTPNSEWVEIYNYGTEAIDLNGWTIEDEDGDVATITTSSLIVNPGCHRILTTDKTSMEAQWFGGIANPEVIQVTGTMLLDNGADEIIIRNTAGNVVWAVAYSNDGVTGAATHLDYNELIGAYNNWGTKASPGITRSGTDVTSSSLGYERNNATTDVLAFASTNSDMGSPLLSNFPSYGGEIEVQGNGLIIANMDNTPAVGDNTDFGVFCSNQGVQSPTFTINNLANGVLDITNITSSDPNFTISSIPNLVGATASETFFVNFNPSTSGIGVYTSTISILSNDCDEDPFTFDVTFEVNDGQEIDLLGNGNTITAGQTATSTADNTNFGALSLGGNDVHTFTIDNTAGTAVLTVSSINVSGANASEFTIAGITFPTTIAAGASTTFTLTFAPTALGARTATVTVNNDDCDEAAYNFAVIGTATPTPIISANFAGPILNPFSLTDVNDRLAPTFGDLDGDGDLDMIWGSEYAILGYFENIGTATAPNYAANQTLPFGLTDQGNESRPRLVDLDNDGDLDLMIAVNTGLTYFENIGTATTPNFASAQTNPFGLGNFGSFRSTPTFGDLDNDGDLDLIVGSDNGDFTYIENIGTLTAPNFDFANRTTNPFNLTTIGGPGNPSSPYLVDWDYDGDLDLIAAEIASVINYFENTGTASAPNFAPVQQNPFCLSSMVLLDGIEVVDLDLDGDQDIMVANSSGFYFLEANVFAEIDLRGNGLSIANGDLTPNAADHTDLGEAVFCLGQTTQRTFTIDNSAGNIALNVTNVTSSNPEFTISGISTPLIVAAGSSSTFEVTFAPTALGTASSTITIANDDCDEAPYTFEVQARGTNPALDIVRGDALEFDGLANYVSTPNTTIGTSFTAEAWVSLNTLSTNVGFPVAIGKWNTTANHRDFTLGYRSDVQKFYSRLGNEGNGTTVDLVSSSTPTPNQWVHLAVTYDGTTQRLYINGILEASDATANQFDVTGSQIRIGDTQDNTNSWQGKIDEVRIWNTARTAEEIRENMHLTLVGCETSLNAYYQFNDGVGASTLEDVTNSANNGTLTNMNPSSDWVASGVNVGNDVASASNSQTVVAVPIGSSTRIFPTANLSMRFIDHSDVEDYTVTYQAFTPNVITGTDGINIIQNPMWTVNKSSSTATQLVDYTFTLPAATFTNLDPTKYSLYWRPMYADGAWTKLATANAVTANTVSFGKISLIGQFMVVQTSEVLVSDVRGNMYELDGVNDRIVSSNNSGITGAAPRTLEAWVYANSTGGPNFVVALGNTSTTFADFTIFIINGFYNVHYHNVGFNTGYAVTPNEWHHFTATYDGTTVRTYVDGVPTPNPSQVQPSINTTDAPITLGAIPSLGCCHANVKMDEVRVWSVARTQDEIRENMHLTLKGNETGLAAYYQFNNDDPAGTINGVKDATGNNDATTQNMALTAYLPSEVAVAGGSSDRLTIAGAGTTNFPNTGVNIDFGASNPNGEIVVYRLETEKPHGWETIIGDVDNEYFVVRNFGTNTTFSALNDITFNRVSYVSPLDVGLPQASSPLQLYKRASNAFGPTWGASLGGADNATAGSNGSISYNASNNITSFSQIVLTNAGLNTDLPVELMSFTAKRSNADQVQLNWITASELNNRGFYIERMLEVEGIFETVGFIEGMGTASTITNYQFMDQNSYSGTSYYRLRQVDFDGTTTYSEIRAVAGEGNVTQNTQYIDVSIYPNPVYDQLNVRFNELPKNATYADVKILSIDGKILHTFRAGVQSYQVLNIEYVQQLPSAMYILSIELNNQEQIQQKFIKQQK